MTAHAPWHYDDFVPGREIGRHAEALDERLIRQFRRVYGPAGNTADMPDRALDRPESAGLVIVMMMRAYLGIVTPRPPGNIHARQRLRLQSLPSAGDVLDTVLHCHGKELRRGRRCVDFEATGTTAGHRPVYTGLLTLVWAA